MESGADVLILSVVLVCKVSCHVLVGKQITPTEKISKYLVDMFACCAMRVLWIKNHKLSLLFPLHTKKVVNCRRVSPRWEGGLCLSL